MLLSQCIAATRGRLINGDCEFRRLSTDTRQIGAGDLFVALRGERFDAHEFVEQAVSAGACALVLEQEDSAIDLPQLIVPNTTVALGEIAALQRDQFSGVVIGITGSSGKTSVKGMLAAVLATAGSVVATKGNLNNQIGMPLTLMRLAEEPQFAVIEMGASRPGDIAYLAGLARPQVAVVNNVMAAHLEGLGSLRGVAEEKAKIYSHLQSGDSAVINLDDDFAEFFLEQTRQVKRWGFSVNDQRAIPSGVIGVQARNLVQDEFGRVSFDIVYDSGSAAVKLAVAGAHNVANALAAASCAFAAGLGIDEVAAGLGQFAGEAGRMQIGSAWNGATLVNDTYNANPGSVRAAIDYLASLSRPRMLVLGNLGELGAGAEQVVREIGVYAKQKNLDQLVTCGDLAQQAALGFGDGAAHFEAQEQAVEFVKSILRPDAVILVKGSRSARMENVVAALGQTGEQQ